MWHSDYLVDQTNFLKKIYINLPQTHFKKEIKIYELSHKLDYFK
jgi:hypothetical protein